MDKKLAEYRARKSREIKQQEIKLRLKNWYDKLFSSNKNKMYKKEDETAIIEIKNDVPQNLEDFQEEDDDDDDEEDLDSVKCCTYVEILYYFSWFSLWVISYIIFIQLEFGTVYLLVSGLVAMYLNTRSGPKKTNEISAYSVFNKNCESIDGTLTAEQLQREMLYGPRLM